MTQQFQCNSCGGRYLDTQPDGTFYFHVCPPLPPDKDGLVIERPNKRDENIAVNSSGRLIGIRSEGDGAQCLTRPALTEPAWLGSMKAKLNAAEQAK